MSEEQTKQINNLERKNERLLSELVHSASQRDEEMKKVREVYEGHLKEATNTAMIVEKDLCAIKAEADKRRKDALETSQVNKCLKEQLQEAESIISEKERSVAQITSDKASLEANLKETADAQKKLIEHNEYLSARLMELENESASLRQQLQELNVQPEKKVHFRDIFADLEHRIINLEMRQEEITANKNVQLERIDTIAEQLSKLDVEAQILHHEREDMAAICDTQERELARTVGKLMSLKERLGKNYLLQFDMLDDFSTESLEATVSELEAFVESSKMRISDIDQQIKEVEEEKSVLMQQQSHALERKNEYVNC
jgi:chromosome segregation ATPase